MLSNSVEKKLQAGNTRPAQALDSSAQAKALSRAVGVLRSGGVVAFPTETVYGLGADCRNAVAVRRIFEVKGRPPGHPLIVHLADSGQLADYACEVPALAQELAAAFWPGPLTIILRRSSLVGSEVTGGLETVGLRVPAHPLALALLRELGSGIAAPSANRFGSVSPTTAEHVRHDLGDSVDFILDGGPCKIGIESTIVDLSGGVLRLLRPGAVTREQIEAVAGQALDDEATQSKVRAPGLLRSHYSPKAQVMLVASDALAGELSAQAQTGRRVAVLAAEGSSAAALAGKDLISLPEGLEGQAHELYAALRLADEREYELLLVCLPEERGLGLALADRLRRAAGMGEEPEAT